MLKAEKSNIYSFLSLFLMPLQTQPPHLKENWGKKSNLEVPERFITLLKKHPTINSQFRSGERKVLCEETEGTPSTAVSWVAV